ncbi:MAG: alpha/beta hydrolase [Pirellulaceae bacterium]
MPTPLGLAAGLRYPGDQHVDLHGEPGDEVPIFILSGRNVESEEKGLDPFGKKRNRIPTLGIAYVKIGDGLTAEELREETVTSRRRKKAIVEFSRVELSPPLKDFRPWRVKDAEVRHQDSPWVQALKKQLDQSQNRHVVIFVHGYNTELIENTLLAAEIYHYLGREGAMISFEWPSRANLLGYMADKGNATYSTRQFRALVSNVAKECDANSITIVGHSAGSPIVVNALREIRLLDFDLTPEQIQKKYRINRVVLAAPDMDTMAFINAIHDRFYEVAGKVAVYASPKDKALGLSEWLYDDSRLGKAVGRLQPWEQDVLRLVPEIEMVDASVAEEFYSSFLGHSYFHRDPWVSSDIGAFILGRAPELRGLVKQADDVFWKFPKDFPEKLEQLATMPPEIRWAEAEQRTDKESEKSTPNDIR